MDFWVDLDRKNSLAIKNIEDSLIKTIQEEAKFSFGKATSRRIDYEFSEQYKEIKEKLESKEGCFMFILCFLFLGSFISVLVSLKMDIFDLFLSRLIIIAPIVWLLWYLNSQIKEDRRILQTYLHKKVIASSYMNYASTFNENTFIRDNEVKKEMITLLLKLSIETLKENPATLLSKEKQNINTQEIINKLVDKLPIK
ncbi:hypothetical protein [Rodentibacter caecimuris]|uniref:hypothetical protein n=1 Tax=Rodentibacter caecimuris TaxID=1796644 RepID=UPI0022496191|nr:hypothetical protein [Rodentibacter heylii]MCX2960398.1 hypothetical protein [Rodentibacter heylii]